MVKAVEHETSPADRPSTKRKGYDMMQGRPKDPLDVEEKGLAYVRRSRMILTRASLSCMGGTIVKSRYIKPLMLAVVMLLALMSADMARPTPGDDVQEVLAIQFAGSIAVAQGALEVSRQLSFDLTWSYESPLASLPLSDGRVYGDIQGNAVGTADMIMIRGPVPKSMTDSRVQRNAPLKEPRLIRS